MAASTALGVWGNPTVVTTHQRAAIDERRVSGRGSLAGVAPLKANGVIPTEIARKKGIGRARLYRGLGAQMGGYPQEGGLNSERTDGRRR